MNDIQTEMIMNSDSSNIVSDILKELNTPTQMASVASHAPIHVQMQERAQPVQPNQSNLGLNENAVINQYNNTNISNEMQLNRQMDPHMNLNPNVRLDMKDQANLERLQQSQHNKQKNNTYSFLTRRFLIRLLRMVKNIVILLVILLVFLSPIANTLSVKYLPKLFSSSSSQLFKWIGLVIKALLISVIYNVIYVFI